MSSIAGMDIEEAARQAVGNWRKFQSFVWWRARDIDDAGNFAIRYTKNRDSGLLDQSNAAALAKALEPFTDGDDPDVIEERHSHFACGWIDGFAIRVFRNGQITDAFRTYHGLVERLCDYPVLDDEDYSRREYDDRLSAAFSNGTKSALWPGPQRAGRIAGQSCVIGLKQFATSPSATRLGARRQPGSET